MVNINEAFPSKYLKASDLQGEIVKVKIRDAVIEELGSDRRLVLYFAGKEKGLVTNKTNAMTIGEAFGIDTDDWAGKVIELFSMKVEFNGRMVDGLRVRVPKQGKPQQAKPEDNGWEDENPAPKEKAYAEASGARARPNVDPEMDDSIPFAPEWR